MEKIRQTVQHIYENSRPSETTKRRLAKTSDALFQDGPIGVYRRHQKLGHDKPLMRTFCDMTSGAAFVAARMLGRDPKQTSAHSGGSEQIRLAAALYGIGLALAINGSEGGSNEPDTRTDAQKKTDTALYRMYSGPMLGDPSVRDFQIAYSIHIGEDLDYDTAREYLEDARKRHPTRD